MSKETSKWLNNNVLVGFTSKRGNAWHYKASEQGSEGNHYLEAIPVSDVMRRLFDWQAIEVPLFVQLPASMLDATGVDADGNPIQQLIVPGRKAIAASDTGEVLGVFKDGYQPHQYSEWLLQNVATILDDELSISSAGLLKNRAVAWVEVSVPETITTPEGVSFRPNLLACTSFDGSLATTYKRTVTLTVCDNTMAAALSEKGQTLKVKHSRNSALRLTDAREALAIVYDTADSFSEQIRTLTSQTVSQMQWQRVLDQLVPVPDKTDSKRGHTVALEKRFQLEDMYTGDSRVSPWNGTAFGVLQAFNTWNHHEMPTRGGTMRAERNQLNAINGIGEAADSEVMSALAIALA